MTSKYSVTLSKPTHHGTREMCWIVQYRISEYSGFILVNRNTLEPLIFVGCHRMLEYSGFILVNRNTLGPLIFVWLYMMLEYSGFILVNRNTLGPLIFSSPDPKGQVSYCHHWASVVRPSVNFSHFNQLLWSHWPNLNQTLVEWVYSLLTTEFSIS